MEPHVSERSLQRSPKAPLYGALMIAPLLAGMVTAQGTDTRPRFDVVSIRLNKNCFDAGAIPPASPNAPGRLAMHCMPLESAIRSAYVIYADGVSAVPSNTPLEGAPSWLSTDLYDIDAVAAGAPRQELMRGPMLQTALEDRLKLKVRIEARDAPVYELTVASGGHKLQLFKAGSCTPLPAVPSGPPATGEPSYCRTTFHPVPPDYATVIFDDHAVSLATFAGRLGAAMDRPIVDRTGIQGLFDIHLEFSPDGTTPRFLRPGVPAPDGTQPILFRAVQEQLGLRLQSAHGQRRVAVIEQIERPSEN